jgi:hypothetical protein
VRIPFLIACLCLLLAPLACLADARDENALPVEVLAALRSPDSMELYSLEPDTWRHQTGAPPTQGELHGFAILGHAELSGLDRRIASDAFEASVAAWDGMLAACFEPRHALRVAHAGHVYDLMLCYACQQMEIHRDGKPMTGVGAAGSAKALNELLVAKGIPLPYEYTQAAIDERERERQASREHWARWQQATPRSIAAILEGDASYRSGLPGDVSRLGPALVADVPDRNARILALFEWFGSGAGPWSGYPGYESVPEALLLEYPTAELVAAASSTMTDRQKEGAARLFGGWQFNHDRPHDAAALPAPLKSDLLAHVRAGGDADNIKRAESWLGD